MRQPSFEQRFALLAAVLALCLSACGAKQPVVTRRPPTPSAVARLPPGAVLALPRPTPGLARLSLWFDVGTRDAPAPELATATAFWAADQAQLKAQVLPEAIELSLDCDTQHDSIENCVGRLVRVFRTTRPSDEEVIVLRDRIRQLRRRSRVSSTRVSEELALEALLGVEARALFPFGHDENDTRIVAAAIEDFARSSLRPERVLLVGVGDVQPEALERAFRSAAVRGMHGQSGVRIPLVPHSGLHVEAGDASTITLALAVPDLNAAAVLGRELGALYGGARIEVTRLREHALLLVHVTTPAVPFRKLQHLVFDVRRIALEESGREAPVRGESLADLAKEMGEEWAMRTAEPTALSVPWPLGIALTIQDSPFKATDDAKLKVQREAWEKAAKESIARGEALALGPVRGDSNSERADVVAESGAHIRVERREGTRAMAAYVRLLGGSAEDPADRHGRAALLATLLANDCGPLRGPHLDTKLDAIDARLRPLVTPDGLGVRIVAPSGRTREALDVLLRCVLRPALDTRSVEDARTRLISALNSRDSILFEAFAAQATLPNAPGAVAAWGTPLGVSRIDAAELRRLHQQTLVGKRLEVSIVADEEPIELARYAARRVGSLEVGTYDPPHLVAPPQGRDQLLGEHTRVRALHALIALRTGSARRAQSAAHVVADALGKELENKAGRVAWASGAGAEVGSWSAVAVNLGEDDLAAFDARVLSALAALRGKGDAFWLPKLRAEGRAAIAQRATSEGFADLVFANLDGELNEQSELAAVRELLAVAPSYAILRPPR